MTDVEGFRLQGFEGNPLHRTTPATPRCPMRTGDKPLHRPAIESHPFARLRIQAQNLRFVRLHPPQAALVPRTLILRKRMRWLLGSIVPGGADVSRSFRLEEGTNTENPNPIFPFAVNELIAASFARWSDVANIEFVQIKDNATVLGGNDGIADIRIGFARIDGSGSVSGLGTHPNRGGDIVIEADGGTRLNDEGTFQNILTHEIGHTVGLDHENDIPALMSVVSNSNPELREDDIEGIQTIYGVQDDSRPTLRLDPEDGRIKLLEAVEDMRVVGSLAQDNVRGSRGDELVVGRAGNDRLHGGAGADTVRGGAGEDIVKGGGGADKLFGNGGDDRLVGGLGADTLTGHGGDDVMTGGRGADQFNFVTSFGEDRINGFDVGEDILSFRRSRDVEAFEDLTITDTDAGVVIADVDGDAVLLAEISAADLTQDDFLF